MCVGTVRPPRRTSALFLLVGLEDESGTRDHGRAPPSKFTATISATRVKRVMTILKPPTLPSLAPKVRRVGHVGRRNQSCALRVFFYRARGRLDPADGDFLLPPTQSPSVTYTTVVVVNVSILLHTLRTRDSSLTSKKTFPRFLWTFVT